VNGYEEKIKDRLFLEVCNAAGREEWDGLEHQQKENLMLVCRLSGHDEKFQRDCGLVTREQMEHWGIEEEVLFQDAWANMFAKRPPVFMDFEDAYEHNYDQNILAMEKKPERIWRTDADFYVLTNNVDHGAVYMMDEATLQKSAEKLDANLIVLPASIHEVYLMVEREGLDMERLRDGVYGANRAFPEADYLSDEIYRYDRDTHRLSVIPGSVQEEQAGMVLYQ
jgi:hypothetical protein